MEPPVSVKTTRYEHTLGTFQAARRYLLALLDDDHFLKAFSPKHIEFCLVCSLLVGVTRFPFSTIIHEIRGHDRSACGRLSRKPLLDELLSSEQFKDRHGWTLSDVISSFYPIITVDEVKQLLAGGPKALQGVAERFVYFILNSSIDARVLDYLRRDSLHLGISTGHEFNMGDLLPHVVFDRGRLSVRTSGLSVVEQIVSLRYWLFNRIYWNRQNRSLIAMIRHVLLMLRELCGDAFEDRLHERALQSSEAELLHFFEDLGRESGDGTVLDICQLLRAPRPRRFDEIYQCNRSEDDAVSRQICDKISEFTLSQFKDLQAELNDAANETIGQKRCNILIDIPVERGSMKLGDDLNVITPNNTIVPLDRLSGIVRGVQQSFVEQLQRVRIFIHPEAVDVLDANQRSNVRKKIRSTLEAIL